MSSSVVPVKESDPQTDVAPTHGPDQSVDHSKKRSSSEKQHSASSDLEKGKDDVDPVTGLAKGEIADPVELGRRLEASGVSDSYERKVYILNRVMNEHIGMGRFQYALFCLSGFGWFVDNLWLQGVAIILPAVQREFGKEQIQWMTFALYVGLIIGAAGWGILADVIGRRLAFNATLALSGIFGIAAGGAPNFVGLGGLLAALGVGLGGNLPVDGMLFLEFIPGNKQYLLTLLSVFWSLGQLFASLIAWAFIANYTCQGSNLQSSTQFEQNGGCNADDNMGWRYTFYTLGAVTFVMFLCRFAVFQLPESPKFLVAQGRDAEAVRTLREIARRNGKVLGNDVISVSILRTAAGEEVGMNDEEAELPEDKRGFVGLAYSVISIPKAIFHALKNFKLSNLRPDLTHVTPLFSGASMAYNTATIFMLWSFIGLAYPLFNAFLPLYLQNKQVGTSASSVSQTYSEYAYISICGVPGSIIAAWLVDLPRSGRRGAMAIGTLLTGVFVFAGVGAPNRPAFLAFNCLEACFQNIMYGVLYAYTPEVFPAPHRGTGDGIASSLNRVFGLFSPIIAIYTGEKQANAPLFTSGALFLFSAVLMLTLRVDSAGKTAL